MDRNDLDYSVNVDEIITELANQIGKLSLELAASRLAIQKMQKVIANLQSFDGETLIKAQAEKPGF